MKCISCYCYNGEEYRLYVDVDSKTWFVLLPSFKITKYMNNRSIPEAAREVFEKRLGQFDRGEIHFKGDNMLP